MIEQAGRVTTVLSSLECLEVTGDVAGKDLQLVKAIRELRAQGATELPTDFDASCVDAPWRPYVDDADRGRALRALCACALTRMRKGLMGGRLWVPHSASYRSRSDMLIPDAEWKRSKQELCHALGLEMNPKAAIEKQTLLLRAGLDAVATAMTKGLLEIDAGGSIRLPKLRALEEEPALRRTAQSIQDLVGPVQLSDLMVEMDALTRFSSKLLGRDAAAVKELVALYAALLAHGTEVDAKSAAAMIPGVAVSQVTAAMRMLETPGRLRSANDAVVAFQQAQPIVKLWSDGSKASSDMSLAKLLRFDLCPQLAGLPDCSLWLPRGMKVPAEFERVAVANINIKAIIEGWDDLLRLVASIMTGRVIVGWALARHGSAAAGDRLYRALDHFGRLLRSVFLCDYFSNDLFRREIHTLLNRGESVHQLQRAIDRRCWQALSSCSTGWLNLDPASVSIGNRQ